MIDFLDWFAAEVGLHAKGQPASSELAHIAGVGQARLRRMGLGGIGERSAGLLRLSDKLCLLRPLWHGNRRIARNALGAIDMGRYLTVAQNFSRFIKYLH
ncbi:hypothetical protein NIES30_17495 [Phormidium tenue NIES-30]|uniref:Uncharacterized protein n=1 Tax=Phormidium tenue NIES-30 TaxID=549789 RepID=A0A1U7J252_9CYAN|nr:hypothetical protein NIES30_17495 [Phormidium tenue NIES-30]